ncbi:hypothetical protein [Mucilaginibacter sp. AK015]|uniref:hypothetical protein n=1 Tax=Mucilaginibacter sp. AK015 TaxID=2723072 RepID=UPI00161D43FB|nr:hypothetical protein [Mucilaginibacter sp. AK015]MBB5396354.1 hypothetical protein [Mucilaginibacter sp. AK015]
MTIVGDSSYIKGNPDKLANNTYRQHDADFSGLVLYFTPKGKYVNGYAYKNGQLVTPGSQTQAQGKTRVQLVMQCTDWYYDVYVNGVLVGSVYLYTTCTAQNPNDPGSSGTPAPPNPCDTPQPPSTDPNPPSTPNQPPVPPVPLAIPGHIAINNVPGGGFPPPTDEDDPCPPHDYDIINKVKDPCLKAMVDAVINKDITTVINAMIQNVFGGSSKVNIKYIDAPLNPGQEGYTPPPSSLDPDGNLTITVQLNKNELPNYSQEFISTVIIHESIHAYLTTIGTFGKLQHETIATVFANQMALDLRQMYPNLSESDAKYLAWGGLTMTDDFQNNMASDAGILGSFEATQDAFSIGTAGTKCNK